MTGLFSEHELDELGRKMARLAYSAAFEGDRAPLQSLLGAGLPHEGEEVVFGTELLIWALFVYNVMLVTALPTREGQRVQKAMLRVAHDANTAMREQNGVEKLLNFHWDALVNDRWSEYSKLLAIPDDRGPIALADAVASHLSGGRPADPRIAMPMLVYFKTIVKNVQPGIHRLWANAAAERRALG